MERTEIFISYSKLDKIWKDHLLAHLKAVIRNESVEYFDDEMIKTGEDWDETIQTALSRAKVIIVILSQNFFGSDYIFAKELPQAVEQAKNEGVLLIQVVVRSYYTPDDYGLNKFQAAHDIAVPLSTTDQGYQDEVFSDIARQIDASLKNNSKNGPTITAEKKKEELPKPKVETPLNSDNFFSIETVAMLCAKQNSKFLALEAWVRNSLSEWKMMDDKINSYELRIKSVESLYKKTKSLYLANPSQFEDVSEIFNRINDIVGARVLVYTPSHIMTFHLEVLSHPRFKVDQITVHHNDDFSSDVIENVIELARTMDDIPLAVKNTKSGYTAIHYTIKPDPVDDFYKVEGKHLFDRFELQVRTIVQHAWSENEHRAIYKSKSAQEKNAIRAKFELLAEVINNADKLLDRLVKESNLTQSRTSDIPTSEIPIVLESIKFVEQIESGKLIEVYEEANSFTENNKTEIYDILNNGTYSEKLSVAEVYLKGGLFKRAYDVYRRLLEQTNETEKLYDWAILRFIEVCDMISESDDIRYWVDILGKHLLSMTTIEKEDRKLFLGASFYAWKSKSLNLAIDLGDILIENVQANETKLAMKAWCNQLYFLLEKALLQYTENELLEQLLKLEHIEKQIHSLANNGAVMEKNHLDSLGWYAYNLGKSYFATDKAKALEQAQIAQDYFKTIMDNWNGEDQPGVAALWLYHKSQTERLLILLRNT